MFLFEWFWRRDSKSNLGQVAPSWGKASISISGQHVLQHKVTQSKQSSIKKDLYWGGKSLFLLSRGFACMFWAFMDYFRPFLLPAAGVSSRLISYMSESWQWYIFLRGLYVRCSHSGVSSVIQSRSGLVSRASLRLNIAGKQQSFFLCFHSCHEHTKHVELFKHMLNNWIVFFIAD